MKYALIILAMLIVGAGALMVAVDNPRPREADLIFISASDLHNLDPQRTHWSVDFRILECLYEPLVRFRLPDQQLEPAAAANWKVSDDKRTYTFHIRPEARWSNGDPVLSTDFKYAWRRALSPDFASAYTGMLYCIEGAQDFWQWRTDELEKYARLPDDQRSDEAASRLWEQSREQFDRMVGVQTPDDHTLIVHLTNPTAYFLDLCAFMTLAPVHEASIESDLIGPDANTGLVEQSHEYFKPGVLIGNGPYLLQSRRPKENLLLIANDHYWNRAAMGNQSVMMKVNDNPYTALMQIQTGEADWWPDAPSTDQFAADLIERKFPNMHVYPACATYFLTFNCTDLLPDGSPNPFTDARVRRAFSLAINRRAIVQTITRVNQPVALSFVPPNVFAGYAPPTQAGANHDPDQARRLLAEAGYPQGRGLAPLPVLVDNNEGHKLIFQQLKNIWEQELGATIELDIKEPRIWGQMRSSQKFAIARRNWSGDYGDATTFLYLLQTGDGNNEGLWSNRNYDDLLAKADRETDAAQRIELLKQAERLLLIEQPVAPLFHSVLIEMFDPARVKNLHPNPMKRRRIELIQVIASE